MGIVEDVKKINFDQESMVTLLSHWVNINSGSNNIKGLDAMRAALIDAFAPLEAEIEEIPLPPRVEVDERGELYEVPIGKALRLSKRPQAPVQVFLGGHMDTVYPKDSPFNQAEMVSQEIMKGPGAADMKGGLVVILEALKVLESFPEKERVGWEVLITPDEELGSPSSKGLLAESAKRHHLGLIFEPSYPDGSLAGKRKGSINFTVIAKGKSAHAGRNLEEGVNAISALIPCLEEIESLTDDNLGIGVNLGTIRGGSAVNIVPDRAICKCNIRMREMVDYEALPKKLKQMIDAHNAKSKAEISLHFNSQRPPKELKGNTLSLFETIQECAKDLGYEISLTPSGGVCDGNTLSAFGLPVIDTLGPRGDNLHTFKESVYLNTMVPRAALCALFLLKLASGELSPPTKGN